MQLQHVFLVILDIGGYTRFIKFHKTALLHAEKIISELMESAIGNSEYPLQLNKLEGDAALLYSVSGGTSAAARDILAQVRRAFDAFYARESVLSERNMCGCDACMNIPRLDLKAIIHHGEVAIKKFRQFEELAGEEVILAHRLLKNTVPGKEYILATRVFHDLLGDAAEGAWEARTEQGEGIGAIQVRVQYPAHGKAPLPVEPPRKSLSPPRVAQLAGLFLHQGLRALGLRRQAFRNIPA